MAKHRPNPADFELMTLSFRVFGKYHRMVHAAAQKKGLSAQQYMTRVILDWAASDLGIDPPNLEAVASGPTQIAEAAKLRGLTVQQFRDYAAREAASKMLEGSTQPRRTISGTQRKTG